MDLVWINRYLQIAKNISEWSIASRLKVGCVVVKNKHIVAQGFNGTLPKTDNNPEENGVTKITCLHAEMNALSYMAREGIPTKDCDIFISHSPCVNCCLLIAACQIKSVYYSEDYRDKSGFEILNLANIKITKI